MISESERATTDYLLAVEDAWVAMPITRPQAQVLFLAVAHEGISGPEVQRKLDMLPSTLTRLANILVRDGWLNREDKPTDRRQVIYQPTEAGRALVLGLLPRP